MTSLFRPIVSGTVCLIFVITATFYPLLEARAADEDLWAAGLDCAAGKLGIDTATITGGFNVNTVTGQKIPVNDDATQAAIKKGACDVFVRELKNVALRAARQVLKRRILDAMVDQVVQWINNDFKGNPRFVDDFGGFLNNAFDVAVGDVVTELGLGDLCSPNLKIRLGLNLQTTGFQNNVRCTIKDIQNNLENFNKDFRSGSWYGYNESLKPQNNKWGLEIMAKSELEKRQAQQKESKQYEVLSGSGFLGVKECIAWNLYAKVNADNRYGIVYQNIAPNDPILGGGEHKDPDATLPIPALYSAATFGSYWKCASVKTSTPGRFLADTLQKASGASFDYIVNADDLSDYLAVITDALINRAIVNGLKSVSGKPTDSWQQTGGGAGQGGVFTAGNSGGLGADYIRAQQDWRYSTSKTNLFAQTTNASSSVSEAKDNYIFSLAFASSTKDLHTAFQGWCKTGSNMTIHPLSCVPYSNNDLITRAEQRINLLQNRIAEMNTLRNQIISLESQIETVTGATLATLTQEINALAIAASEKAVEAETLANEIQTEFDTAQALFSKCKISAVPADCP